jgi:predicted hydrocarbon binding protein
MRRSDFLFSCAGLCSCTGLAALAAPAAEAQNPNPELDALQWKLGAARDRFAKLVGILNQTLDEPTRKTIFNRLGRQCSANYRKMVSEHPNVQSFLDAARKSWVESAEYDEKAGTLRIVDKATTCTCPLVLAGATPGSFCDCTLGWQEAIYSELLGKPVKAEVEESILRGGKRCVFRVKVV